MTTQNPVHDMASVHTCRCTRAPFDWGFYACLVSCRRHVKVHSHVCPVRCAWPVMTGAPIVRSKGIAVRVKVRGRTLGGW